MKNWLYETKLLLPFFIIISFFLTMSLALITSSSQAQSLKYPFMSQNGVSFSIVNENGKMKNKDFIVFCKAFPEDFIVIKENSFSNIAELYSSELISISKDQSYDYSTANPMVLLSNDRRRECVEQDGKLYFTYGNRSHPVAGWFDGSVDDSGYTCVVSLFSVLEAHADVSFTGTYALDAGKDTPAALEALEEYCSGFQGVTVNRLGPVGGQENESMAMDKQLILAAVGLLTLLLCLNIVRLLDNWLSLKWRECRVRSLLGASDVRLLVHLGGSYAPVILCSTLLGTGLAWLVSLFHPFSFVSFQMSVAAAGYAALGMLLLGVLTFGALLLLYRRRCGKEGGA